jgi:hypothetical protein
MNTTLTEGVAFAAMHLLSLLNYKGYGHGLPYLVCFYMTVML